MDDIVKYLVDPEVEQGAELENVQIRAKLENRDSKGNTVLHVLDVMRDDEAACSMAKLVLKLVDKQMKTLREKYKHGEIQQADFNQRKEKLDLEKIENNAGLTPVMLAATCGNRESIWEKLPGK
ncbi:uncharacterized protein LOC144908117 [Branchiostoma floridae x Branchiostoma belcheri]